jgi:hypothetical protein
MSLGMTIVMLIASWLAVAFAMLWGVLRISRRHHHRSFRSPQPATPVKKRRHPKARPAGVH